VLVFAQKSSFVAINFKKKKKKKIKKKKKKKKKRKKKRYLFGVLDTFTSTVSSKLLNSSNVHKLSLLANQVSLKAKN
jgi:uncharacterized Fe-S cluster-containing protein